MRSQFLFGVVGTLVLAASPIGVVSAWGLEPATCASLAQFHAPDLTITTATDVEPQAKIAGATITAPFCRVVGYLTPTSDSHIGFELWLPPAAAWNHKFQAIGNGGFAGSLNIRGLLPVVARGYAGMTTDEGHLGDPANVVEDVTWALGHPEKFIDYAYRAEHVTTVASKLIVDAYYGAEPTHSYYTGCSAGGIQGLVELLRFPKDFDGYIVGDATPNHLGQEVGAFYNTMQASLGDPAEAFQPAQIALIHDKVLKACVGKDGGVGTDGFLSNPLACNFDPKTLACVAGQDPTTCISQKQVTELTAIYKGLTDPATHKRVLAGLSPGAELTWDRYISGKKNPAGVERPWAGFMADVAMTDADYLTQQKYLKFNFGSDLTVVNQKKLSGQTLDAVFNSTNRNLDPVKAEGGKVIQYHGWDDPNIPAMEAVDLFNEVVADQAKRHSLSQQKAQEETEQFYRLFMVPGMGHCMAGAGTGFGQAGPRASTTDPETDPLTALEVWVEKGVAPEKMIGSHAADAKTGAAAFTRPVCAFPKVPTWNGTGNTNDASSFVCAEQPQSQQGKK